jgi:hypothetical protein
MMDLYGLLPLIMVSIVGAITIFVLIHYLRTKKLPPTDEPVVGEYRIEVDVGTHIIPFEGTLYYNTKYLNEQLFHQFAQVITKQDKVTKEQVNELKEYLQKKCHCYAMRSGTKKLAFLSLEHPIETTPFFKTEEGTGKKIVHATGFFTRNEIHGFQQITFEPVSLRNYELNPQDYENLGKTGQIVALINEKGPLLQELKAEKEKNRVLQSKVDDLADDVGKLKDEVEYWKYEAKSKGVEEKEEKGVRIPKFIRKILPYGILFIIGYAVSPSIPQLGDYHPAILGVVLVILGFIGRKVLGR